MHTTDTYITHTYIHTYIYTNTHTYVHTHTHTHTHIYIYTHIYIHSHTHTHFSIVTAMHGRPAKVSSHKHFQSIHILDSKRVFTVSEHSRHISINF